MTTRTGPARFLAPALLVVAAVGALVVWRGCSHRASDAPAVPFDTVQRRDIAVTIEATGTVEPIDLVEVKSKASGQILTMPIEVGSVVKTGALIAQIDTVTVQNQYDQAYAALRAAQSKVDISRAQKKRSDDLFAQGVITADEHDAAVLDYANAEAALVKARTDLDTARQARQDATVRAPSAGTILEQLVTVGQVIASATSSVSGGTALVHMADLSRIRLRALVAETDIGSVRPGENATVTVDAFPQRPFQGVVEKIEPLAVVQQSVTMFPVLISIANEQGLLLPGMNGEVSMLIAEHDGVLAVPLDAVRTAREIPAVAGALGMIPDSVKANVQRQVEARMQARAAAFGADSGAARAAGMGAGAGAPGGRDSTRARRFGAPGIAGSGGSGGFGRGAGRDSAARARWMAQRGAGGGGFGGGFGGAGRAGTGRGGTGGAAGGAPGTAGSGGNGAGSGGFGGGNGGGARGMRAQVVFVKTANGLEPRVVGIGLSNFDYAQVLDGLKEGDQVALLSIAEVQAKRKADQSQFRQRVGGAVPGVGGAGGGGGRPPGGGGGR